MEKTEAILIGRTRYAESSLIVHWCSPDVGLFKTIAKGALRPKSPFSGVLDLFVSADLRFVRSKSSDLHTLAEARWTHPRLGLRESYGRVLAATYLVKLVSLVAESGSPIPEIHDLLVKALDYLAAKDPVPALITRFEQRLAEILGIIPGGDSGMASAAIEDSFHRKLPVQRRQLADWMMKH
ncbi:DNA repair protein RecO [Prosthecobacter vanneervenii]|uniref:DNA repair protein RecO n=1 Tax=Prosthecobacter vanneervenii TaxID=48466 RepID=A0A7W7YE05_9BACT|nr:DNA repair protein RecO [Prosthecobacter vanneervenii]MBB5034450.1 DNA repair protein RecO (recombination protein O) [Prosthecobacter vanneervenii]